MTRKWYLVTHGWLSWILRWNVILNTPLTLGFLELSTIECWTYCEKNTRVVQFFRLILLKIRFQIMYRHKYSVLKNAAIQPQLVINHLWHWTLVSRLTVHCEKSLRFDAGLLVQCSKIVCSVCPLWSSRHVGNVLQTTPQLSQNTLLLCVSSVILLVLTLPVFVIMAIKI